MDTSIFGGFFDDEFQELTKPLFERMAKGEFTILFSTLLEEELKMAPDKVRELVFALKKDDTEFIIETSDAIDLATEYIGESSRTNQLFRLPAYCTRNYQSS